MADIHSPLNLKNRQLLAGSRRIVLFFLSFDASLSPKLAGFGIDTEQIDLSRENDLAFVYGRLSGYMIVSME